jgi:ferric-dicitrate binding protein FerR (iron transport regulator)
MHHDAGLGCATGKNVEFGRQLDHSGVGRDRLLRQNVAAVTDRAIMKPITPTGCMALVAGITLASGLGAQELDGCRESQRADPPRTVYECQNGLVLEVEAAAALTEQALSGAGPASITLSEGGMLVGAPEPSHPLQILTPHAVASVRGTTFVVDVDPDATGVFTVEGAVTVARSDGRDEVLLGPGEGVDVAPDDPLEVRSWPEERVTPLLARFGR